VALIVAFVVAAALTPLAARVAVRLGVVDRPGPLKVHDRPVPYLGGAAVFVAMAGPVLLTRPALLAPLLLALLLGIADDATDLPARLRLPCEVVIGAVAAATVPARGPLGVLATVVVVVVLINALNLLDGLDGLASGVGAMSALGFAVVLDDDFRTLALALAGALGGFLLWNRPPARIYLGDGGSYLVGTALALLLAGAWGTGEPVALAAGAVLFVAVPLTNTSVAVVRRFRARRPLFQGDRGHVYDQLVDRGWAAQTVTAACIATAALLALVGVGVVALPGPAALATTAACVVLIGGTVLWAFTSPASWSR
jgi:UDP-GlcNAc:undecaprenyl-phosphate GlcNAc-1-phosphate transferase